MMAQGSIGQFKLLLFISLLALALAGFGLYKAISLERILNRVPEFSSYTFQLDGGTHLIKVRSRWIEDKEVLYLGVTSSWPDGVPEKWNPVFPGAKSIRWWADQVNCRDKEWISSNHDTFWGLGGSGGQPAHTDHWGSKKTFAGARWSGKAQIFEYICGLHEWENY